MEPAPGELAILKDDQLAVICGDRLKIVSAADGSEQQSFTLPEPGSAVAVDPGGQWIAVGTVRGTVAVYDREEREQFEAGDATKLHQGAVTALCFEPDELRLLSAGIDGKLLSTHIRGKLEPEDRGGRHMHDKPVPALLMGPEPHERFYTGSADSSVRSWPRGAGSKRPATTKEGVAKIRAMAWTQYKGRPHLALACQDASLRLFPLEGDGKLGELAISFRDAYNRAKREFHQDEPRRRETAMRELAAFNDSASIELLAAQINEDADHQLRVLATRLLGDSGNARGHQTPGRSTGLP